ncbi:unnamed protein product [Protopolystoma xenopodis]|uniref:Uncharacterized protein n=1 Tax=Protopolystoma xenopodis TaxID=117903 RepID=A0A448WW85_9PLAT|nr:unnamed protein product [Protopolystoma xenopodis]
MGQGSTTQQTDTDQPDPSVTSRPSHVGVGSGYSWSVFNGFQTAIQDIAHGILSGMGDFGRSADLQLHSDEDGSVDIWVSISMLSMRESQFNRFHRQARGIIRRLATSYPDLVSSTPAVDVTPPPTPAESSSLAAPSTSAPMSVDMLLLEPDFEILNAADSSRTNVGGENETQISAPDTSGPPMAVDISLNQPDFEVATPMEPSSIEDSEMEHYLEHPVNIDHPSRDSSVPPASNIDMPEGNTEQHVPELVIDAGNMSNETVSQAEHTSSEDSQDSRGANAVQQPSNRFPLPREVPLGVLADMISRQRQLWRQAEPYLEYLENMLRCEECVQNREFPNRQHQQRHSSRVDGSVTESSADTGEAASRDESSPDTLPETTTGAFSTAERREPTRVIPWHQRVSVMHIHWLLFRQIKLLHFIFHFCFSNVYIFCMELVTFYV